MKEKINYKAAGVDIDAGNESVNRIKKHVSSTFTDNVLTGIGNFGSLFDLKSVCNEYDHPVMVQSIDGVGTKMIIARMMNDFSTIGVDLLSAAANDILVMGARPITLLDYIATEKISPEKIEEIVKGMSIACKETNVSLVGGEIAEMPDTYEKGKFDIAGFAVGIVDEKKILKNKIKNKKISFLGVTFKPNTDDMRESPSLKLIPKLNKLGALISYYDPTGKKTNFEKLKNVNFINKISLVCKDSDLIILHTEWNEFKNLNFKKLVKKNNFKVFDMRNLYSPSKMKKLNIKYFGVGR